MNILRTIIVASVLSLASITQAHALNTRTWISGKGTDAAGCGPIASPCRSLQYAHDQTASGGEIDVLDPAGYGSVVITKAINIINEGGVAGVLAAAGHNAVEINAGATDSVVLRGLTVEGSRVGYNGIVFNSGRALTIANCLVQGFAKVTGTSGYGIWIKHIAGTPSITITDTTASYNDAIGIVYSPSGSGGGIMSIDRSTASHNGYGMSVYTADSTATDSNFSISQSRALNNAGFGFQFVGPSGLTGYYYASLRDSVSENNGGEGIYVKDNVLFYISRTSALTNRGNGISSSGAGVSIASDTSSFIRRVAANANPQSPF